MAAKYFIPAGTMVQICLASSNGLTWRVYNTKRELYFNSYVHYDGGAYIFREADWHILVPKMSMKEAV